MSGFIVTTPRFRKVQASPQVPTDADRPSMVEVTVKVSAPGYVPKGISLRKRVSPQLFTGEMRSDMLAALEDDPQVESAAIGRRLHLID